MCRLQQNQSETGILLYENENADWVEQLATFSRKNLNWISGLIDLHLEGWIKIERVQ